MIKLLISSVFNREKSNLKLNKKFIIDFSKKKLISFSGSTGKNTRTRKEHKINENRYAIELTRSLFSYSILKKLKI